MFVADIYQFTGMHQLSLWGANISAVRDVWQKDVSQTHAVVSGVIKVLGMDSFGYTWESEGDRHFLNLNINSKFQSVVFKPP